MAQRKELEIDISASGEVTVRVKCVAGQTCVEESKFLEDALGGGIKSRELTSDYYQQPLTGGVGQTTSS